MDRIVIQSRQKDYFKHLHFGVRTVKNAGYIATALFNEGYAAISKIMDFLEIKIGSQCKQYVDSYDAEYIIRQERARLSSTKEARVARRINQIQEQQFFKKSEGFLYGPRIADHLYAATSIQKLIHLNVFSQIDFFIAGGKDNSKDIGPIDLSRYMNMEINCSHHRLYL